MMGPMLRLGTLPHTRSFAGSLADQVYERLKGELFDFSLLPGASFSETELAGRLGASRTPVRQALQRLEREGFVRVHPRSGWQVRPLDFDRLEGLYDVRIVLELAAVERLCAMDRPDDQPALQELQRTWIVPPAQRLPAGRAAADLDGLFHGTLVGAAGNPEMTHIHQGIMEKLGIMRRLDCTQPHRIETTYGEHAVILQAILDRDAHKARALLQAHIEMSKAQVRKLTLHLLHTAHIHYQPG